MTPTPQTPVAEIVLDHSECAAIFQKHRIDYCCKGHQPLEQACAEKGAELGRVMAELAQAIATRRGPAGADPRQLETAALIDHIVDTHHRYLRDALPFLVPLSVKVARVHGVRHPNLLDVRDFTQELSDALLPHLDREEQILFPAMRAQGASSAVVRGEQDLLLQEHLEVGAILEQVRLAADDFQLPEGACASYTTLYRELEATEADILRHVHLENHVLMPRFARKSA